MPSRRCQPFQITPCPPGYWAVWSEARAGHVALCTDSAFSNSTPCMASRSMAGLVGREYP